MKILVIFCGHLRAVNLTAQSILDNLVIPLNADSMIVTRTTLGYSRKDKNLQYASSIQALDNFKTKIGAKLSVIIPEKTNDVRFLTDKPHVMAWVSGKKEKPRSYLLRNSKTQGMLGMFDLIEQSIDRAMFMLSNYDCVIRCRPDLKFHKQINKTMLQAIDENNNIVLGPDFCNVNSGGGANDQFFAVHQKRAQAAFSVFSQLKKYADDNLLFQPEIVLGHHFRCCGLEHRKMPFDFTIVRQNGTETDQRSWKD